MRENVLIKSRSTSLFKREVVRDVDQVLSLCVCVFAVVASVSLRLSLIYSSVKSTEIVIRC